MDNRLRVALAFAGLPLIAVTAWLWFWSRPLFAVGCLLVIAWGVWLTFEYLRWARTLGRR